MAGIGAAIGAVYLIPPAMLPDVIDEATLRDGGVRREAMFYAYFVFCKWDGKKKQGEKNREGGVGSHPQRATRCMKPPLSPACCGETAVCFPYIYIYIHIYLTYLQPRLMCFCVVCAFLMSKGQKFGTGFAVSLSTLALSAFGNYQSGYCAARQDPLVQTTLRTVQGPITAGMVLISLIFAFFYPLSTDKATQNKNRLKALRERANADGLPGTSVKTNSYAPAENGDSSKAILGTIDL